VLGGGVGVMEVDDERERENIIRLGGNLKWRGRNLLRAHRPWHHEGANGSTTQERAPRWGLTAIVENTAYDHTSKGV
jgi:hypothetical protein